MLKKLFPVLVLALIATLFATPAKAQTATDWWRPSSATPMPLQWILDTGDGDPKINLNHTNALRVAQYLGKCPLGATSASQCTLPEAQVFDFDGDYNTRDGAGGHTDRSVVSAYAARGKQTICYMDLGVQEMNDTNTVYDREPAYRFPADRQDKQSGWGGYWVDFTEPGTGTLAPDPRIMAVIEKRIQDWCGGSLPQYVTDPVTGAQSPNPERFLGIEFDEVDYWENNPASPDVTYNSQLAFNRAAYNLAHAYGFAVIHKGDLAQVRDLEPYADATLNEECAQYRECKDEWGPRENDPVSRSCTERHSDGMCGLQIFSKKGKAVWNAEYKATAYDRLCNTYINPAGTANDQRWNGAQYRLGLPWNGGRKPCSYTW